VLSRVGVVLAGILGLALLVAAPAQGLTRPGRAAAGDASGRHITRYEVTATLTADGRAKVAIDFDFDFGNDPGHGPYLTLPTRVSYSDTQDRLFEYSDLTSSAVGAPGQLNEEDTGSALVLRIGDPNQGDISGVHAYHLQYTVNGLVNTANDQHADDQLYWNVIGPGWEIPLAGIQVRVTGPAEVAQVACYAGPHGGTDPCSSATSAGPTATFSQAEVPLGSELTTVTGWPAGTFPGVGPLLGDKASSDSRWTDPWTADRLRPVSVGGGLAAVILLGGGMLAIGRVRRVGRDRAYLGLTPGLRPVSGQATTTGSRDRRAPVAVQFTPPEAVTPGLVGTLVDESADPVDVTATVIDLAVRGYLRIEEVPRSDPGKKPKDWTLYPTRLPDDQLVQHEQDLLAALFAGRAQVRLSDLKTTFRASMLTVQKDLYAEVVERGWFTASPQSVRGRWTAAGVSLVALAFLAGFVLTASSLLPGIGLVPWAVGAVGILVLALAKAAPARTADGTAVLAQTLGFRQYLATAEANQLRFEEGEDIFSRYLPYAIIFGLTDRWARVFAELAAQGRQVPAPGWYTGYYNPGAGIYWGSAFASAMDRFSSIATESLSAPTPGSSGGSGFSGGFSGGGVGGGGGGGW
jgi:uncharacterized membrane protein YgcG